MKVHLMKVVTNASTMFVSYDEEEKIARVLDSTETNSGFSLKDVTDDSSWEVFENVDDILDWVSHIGLVVEEVYKEL